MKKTDVITKRIFTIFIGISAVILSFSVLIFSINNANAEKSYTPKPVNTVVSGKYMMGFQVFPLGDKVKFYVLKWDTESGKGNVYWHDGSKMVLWNSATVPEGAVQ